MKERLEQMDRSLARLLMFTYISFAVHHITSFQFFSLQVGLQPNKLLCLCQGTRFPFVFNRLLGIGRQQYILIEIFSGNLNNVDWCGTSSCSNSCYAGIDSVVRRNLQKSKVALILTILTCASFLHYSTFAKEIAMT